MGNHRGNKQSSWIVSAREWNVEYLAVGQSSESLSFMCRTEFHSNTHTDTHTFDYHSNQRIMHGNICIQPVINSPAIPFKTEKTEKNPFFRPEM